MIDKNYDLVLNFAQQKHEGQFDQDGIPYIKHPEKVASFCHNPTAKIVALLHDVLEDTDITAQELEEFLNNETTLETETVENIVQAVVLLTKTKDTDLDEYYQRIKANELAREVKLADILHNMNPDRHVRHHEAEKKRTYYKQFLYLYS